MRKLIYHFSIPRISWIWILWSAILFQGCNDSTPESSDCSITKNGTKDALDLSILFIGTSHTHYNDLPKMVEQIASSSGDQVYTEMSAPGGYDFERHFKLAETVDAIKSRKWDYIVLQESGWRTALPPVLAEERVHPFADSLKNIIDESNSDVQLILYMTNGYVGGVNAFGETDWCRDDPEVCTYEGMQERIKSTYLRLAEQLDAKIVPCGILWKIIMDQHEDITFHDADGIHPSLAASYTNAIALYSVIAKKPLGNIYRPATLAEKHALQIKDAVTKTLFECNPNWKTFDLRK
jgi:hypothetical protein